MALVLNLLQCFSFWCVLYIITYTFTLWFAKNTSWIIEYSYSCNTYHTFLAMVFCYWEWVVVLILFTWRPLYSGFPNYTAILNFHSFLSCRAHPLNRAGLSLTDACLISRGIPQDQLKFAKKKPVPMPRTILRIKK